MTQPAPEAPRVVRECDYCHASDTAGHHQVVRNEGQGLVMYSGHFQCCAERGCPDGTCNQILSASGSTT